MLLPIEIVVRKFRFDNFIYQTNSIFCFTSCKSLSIFSKNLIPTFAAVGAVVCKKDCQEILAHTHTLERLVKDKLQKGGVPATPSGTATLLRLSPNYLFRPRPLLSVTDFRRPRLSWLDGRCVQGPGTYSPRHG